MFPLILIALALSAGLAAYEFSPKAHAWADDHIVAYRAALVAHRAADAHLSAARTASHPVIAAQHATKAAAANREAAQKTAVAAQTAQTPPQRAAVTQSAVTVDAREDKITDTLADANLAAADAHPDPVVAVQHVHEAEAANQEIAQKTAASAATAQTDPQRAAAATSATKVVDRETKIAAALAKLGAGQCGSRSYARVSPSVKDVLLAKLHGEGMTVTGDNPWDIATHQHDVVLRAIWSPKTQRLTLIVTAGAGGILGSVVCSAVWDKIDPILKEIVG